MLQMRPVIVSGRILASSQILFWSLINDYKRDAATMIHSKTQYPTETLHSVLSKFLVSLDIFLILFCDRTLFAGSETKRFLMQNFCNKVQVVGCWPMLVSVSWLQLYCEDIKSFQKIDK